MYRKVDMIESSKVRTLAQHARKSFTNRIVILGLMLLVTQIAWASTTAERRIRFKKGQTVACVQGTLHHIHDEASFVLHARAGQHMRVNIIGKGPTRGVVTFPSGQQDGGPGGIIFDAHLPETGNYRIRVTESSMGEEWEGTFLLNVRIR
jgi:hypothetical protein